MCAPDQKVNGLLAWANNTGSANCLGLGEPYDALPRLYGHIRWRLGIGGIDGGTRSSLWQPKKFPRKATV